jgi:signal transduction histidine kinase
MFSRWRERLRHTLAFRLALWYAGVFIGSSLALIALTYVLLAATLREYDREAIESTLIQYAAAYTRGGVDGLVQEIRTTQAAAPGPLFVRALGRRRDVIYFSMPEELRRFDPDRIAPPPSGREQAWTVLETPDGTDVLEIASVRLRDGTLFQVGRSTERRSELLARFRRVLLLDFASIILIGLIGGAVLTASALRPIRTLADTVRGIMRTGKTDARVPVQDTGDALGQLGTLVNAMLDRIDAVLAGMRGALDNVAHDLRTPMTRLRGVAESALASNDPATLREALADCLEESDRVIAMLSTLMDISEAETGAMALQRQPVDLADLIRQTVELYEDVAEERGVRIETAINGDLSIPLDRDRMRQVLANLLDNAVKYTPRGGKITFNLTTEGGDAIARVEDTGIGMSAEILPRVFDLFTQEESAREHARGGVGLGLPLVRDLVELHGGTVQARSDGRDKGSVFTVRLPLYKATQP